MTERYTGRILPAVLVGVLGCTGLAACSRPAPPKPSPTVSRPAPTIRPVAAAVGCQAQDPGKWTSPLPAFRVDAMANRLGVPLAQVQHGKYGVAVCERAITPYETEAGSPLLHVAGNPATLGKTCLAIGLQVDKVEPSKNVFALCPAAEL